ncbi:hypothetical protein LTR82_002438 [Friedmanniomyces endolithicus]|uniref:Major facilitator superfamily (MFS) profile domain-containing protein n=1 Tax=Friedmanniomyces endolithicus TaxID=329885 RepID=A0AAN6G0Q6_9PEZI|nr:hypothetical protein LTR82_002438 [Friedmanniomyces endolithicus]
MSVHHGASYPSVLSEEDVDSAATTLRASASSSKAQSLDGGLRKEDGVGADIELEGWKGGGRRRGGRSGGGGGGGDEEDTADVGDDEAEGHENDRLLHAHNDTTLPILSTIHSLDSSLDPILPLPPPPDKPRPVSWSSLPSKPQLTILTLSRLSEPLTQTSLQSYMFYQLKSFHAPGQPPPTDSVVAQQAGILAAAFTGAQMLTAVLWGRLADDERVGRKKVILIGLLGSAIGSLGFGFSRSFAMAVVWRAVGGMLNGNIGVMRTLISEVVREKKYQSRAFLLLPMTFNIGVIIGPILGGLLADPVGSHPGWFGEGYQGWLARWPYALPNVVNAGFLVCSAMGVVFGLEETLEGLRGSRDWGLRVSGWIARRVFRRKPRGTGYEALAVGEGEDEGDVELTGPATLERNKPTAPHRSTTTRRKLPFRRIWTPTVCFTLLAHGLLAMHVGSFNSLWFIFLSTPRYTPNSTNNDHNSTTLHLPPDYHPHPPFTFTGGLALPPPSIGTALAILGVIGISLQLLLYPPLSFHLGTIPSYRLSLLLFPLSYTLTPFLAILPSSAPAPAPASGFLVWTGITALLFVQTLARTFALPATAILVNNSSPHPSVLGTVHGIAQTVSSATRTVGPVVAGWAYGVGLERGVVGLAWWGLAGVAVVGAVAGRWVREGSGWEVFLEGEEEEEREPVERGKG